MYAWCINIVSVYINVQCIIFMFNYIASANIVSVYIVSTNIVSAFSNMQCIIFRFNYIYYLDMFHIQCACTQWWIHGIINGNGVNLCCSNSSTDYLHPSLLKKLLPIVSSSMEEKW